MTDVPPAATPAAPAPVTPASAAELLRRLVTDPAPPPFAVLHREGGPGVEVLVGEVVDVGALADVPLPAPAPGAAPAHHVLALVPYRQVLERGFTCHDDGAPLRCLLVREQAVLDLPAALDLLPSEPVPVTGGAFDVDDGAYAALVERVVTEEVGRGEGANFVLRRDHVSRTAVPPAAAALRLLRRLLLGEPAAYWAFAVHAGDRTMVGATPERHVSVRGGEVVMNPISGTYRYPPAGPSAEGLLRFLDDTKETEELFMVVDEELKMMSRVCADGGRVLGPFLKPMSALAHTEYLLAGHTDLDVREVLLETAFAPTVVGSPVQNATRVIARHERTGRGYYAGVLALVGADAAGGQVLDAPILIRTAHLGVDGEVRVPVGATLVRHSVPAEEVAETHAKAAGVLRALGVVVGGGVSSRAVPALSDRTALLDHPGVPEALARRNRSLAPFWLQPQDDDPRPGLTGRRVLLVDAEDAWTAMLAHQLRRLGAQAVVRRWDDVAVAGGAGACDLLVVGPGPGDPRDATDPRLAALRGLVTERLAHRAPLLGVCLGHQVVAGVLGLPLAALPAPNQGTQRRVAVFGRPATVGFYNTYAAVAPAPGAGPLRHAGAVVEVSAEPGTGEVHALRGPGFASVQFHPESLLSPDGLDVLADLTTGLLGSTAP